MAKLYYNGVLLPEIPADLLSSYPYRWISVKDSIYNLMLSPYPWYRKNENLYTQTSTYVWYQATETAESWGFHKTFTDEGAFNYASNLVWANHDIPDGSATATEIYFEGSEPLSEFPEEPEEPEAPETQYAERYSILGSILVGTARQIMRLTDSTTKVKPEEFEPKLEGINIQLQELTVTATEEVQTITPPSGVYGFSKVIVEAVEDSGSSGGGTGGDGGEDGEESDPILSGDNIAFGVEYVVETKPTGFGTYTYKSDASEAAKTFNGPAIPVSGYCIVWYFGPQLFLYVSPSPFIYNGKLVPSDGSKVTEYKADSNTSPFVATGNTLSYVTNKTIMWNNHDIYSADGSYIVNVKDDDFVEKVTETIVEKPIDYDPTYTISGESLSNIITLAQKTTGSQEPMTLDEAYAALDEYFKQAE